MPIIGIMASSQQANIVTGSFESIATSSPTSGSSITFNSIPSTYKHLQIRAIYRDATNQGQWCQYNIQFNSDTGSNYYTHYLSGNGTATAASGFSGTSVPIRYGGADATYTSIFAASLIDIIDYANTSKNKTIRYFAGLNSNTTATADQGIALGSGLWSSTSAITSITINAALSAFTTGTTFALYGIKG